MSIFNKSAVSSALVALTLSQASAQMFSPGQIFRRDRIQDALFKNDVIGIIKMSPDGDRREKEMRKLITYNPDGIITGSDLLELIQILQKPTSFEQFKQMQLMNGVPEKDIAGKYSDYLKDLDRSLPLQTERALGLLAVSRILDQEAYKQNIDPYTESTELRSLMSYAYRVILAQMDHYVIHSTAESKFIADLKVIQENASTPCGLSQQCMFTPPPRRDITRVSSEELFEAYQKIQAWNEKRVQYSVRTILLQGAALSGKIPTDSVTSTDPKTGKESTVKYPSIEAGKLSNEELYPSFVEFLKGFLGQISGSPLNFAIKWDYAAGGIDSMLKEVTALPDHYRYKNGIKLPGFQNEKQIPATYVEFEEAIRNRMKFINTEIQTFNIVKWDDPNVSPIWAFRDIKKIVDGQKIKPLTVPMEPAFKSHSEIRDRIEKMILPSYTLSVRQQIWQSMLGRSNPRLESSLRDISPREQGKVYELLKEQRFKIESRKVQTQEISVSGPKREAFSQKMAEEIQKSETAFRKEMADQKWTPVQAIEEARKRRGQIWSQLVEKIRADLGSDVAVKATTHSQVGEPITGTLPKDAALEDRIQAQLLSPQAAAAEQSRVIPYLNTWTPRPGEATPAEIRLIMIESAQVNGVRYADPNSSEVQQVVRPIIQQKLMAAAQRNTLYVLLEKNPLDLVNNVCKDAQWECADESAWKIADSLFPETVYPGEPRRSTPGNWIDENRILSIEAGYVDAIFQIPNYRRNAYKP